ncbi:MAG: T9SS type A sorting domain-containing protein [Bacteroidales bacterium]|nr:T9SS type A sorting domain-containing protein [Bacteroidales bacterium]
MKRATFFVPLLTFEISLISQNLVENSGFEAWEKTDRPTGWTHVENCKKDSSFVVSGRYSCLHSGGSSGTSDLGQTIAVIPGKVYTLSFYNRTVITASGKGSRIWCYWKDAEDNSLSDPSTDDILRPSKYFANDSWQLYSVTVTAPAEAAAFYLEVRTNTNSIAYWDNFVFEENVTTFIPEEKLTCVTVYPNPANDYININNIYDLQHIDILTIAGKIVWSSDFTGENSVSIPVSGLRNGMYIIRIQASGKLITRKFIKKEN